MKTRRTLKKSDRQAERALGSLAGLTMVLLRAGYTRDEIVAVIDQVVADKEES